MKGKHVPETLGTFLLTLGGCGSAVLAAKFLTDSDGAPINLGIGLAGVALAFGLTVSSIRKWQVKPATPTELSFHPTRINLKSPTHSL